MEEYQQRVVDELEELKKKLTKLQGFLATEIFAGLSDKEQTLLFKQERAMIEYAYVLAARIRLFTDA